MSFDSSLKTVIPYQATRGRAGSFSDAEIWEPQTPEPDGNARRLLAGHHRAALIVRHLRFGGPECRAGSLGAVRRATFFSGSEPGSWRFLDLDGSVVPSFPADTLARPFLHRMEETGARRRACLGVSAESGAFLGETPRQTREPGGRGNPGSRRTGQGTRPEPVGAPVSWGKMAPQTGFCAVHGGLQRPTFKRWAHERGGRLKAQHFINLLKY